ncbi:MAG TPA: replicative DNA helicase, partial [Actinobacteria bacterium]|nr:replicative DNA helicase [Actinomycetes bacterium]HEX21375.1 replicative DNA helicase [Actinomycetota bacterium]
AELKRSVTGISTGFTELDRMTSGLHDSDLIIVAARPAMGKTSLALAMAKHAALKEKKSVAIFSLEMSRHQLVQRLICSEAKVEAQKLRRGQLSDTGWQKINRAIGRLSEAEIYIDDTPSITAMEIRAKSRRMAKRKLDLIIVDYLQLMVGHKRAESRQQEISEISRSLKILGREMEVPVIAVSQLSRAVESRDNKRPILSDLRESGAIEQDADLVMFIYRDKYYNPDSEDNSAEISISKHRNGPTGRINLAFIEKYTKFENHSHE